MKNTFVKVLSLLMALMMAVGVFGTMSVFAAEHVHTKGEVVKTEAPTCQKIGFTVYKCAECGEQFTDDVIMPSAEYHKIKDFEPVAAGCTTNAWSAGKKCEYCDYIPEGSSRQEYVGTQTQHSFQRRTVAATCSADAKVEYVCTTCNLTAEQLVAKNIAWVAPQTYEAYKEVVTPNSATDKNHDNLSWVIVTAPATGTPGVACSAGTAKGTCASCGFTKTATLPAPHEFDLADGATKLNPTNSTCAEYKSGTACKYCKTASPDAVKYTAEEKTEHCVGSAVKKAFTGKVDATNLPKKSDGSTITLTTLRTFGLDNGSEMYTAPTCTTTGLQLVECVCGELKYIVVPALGHTTKDDAATWDNISEIVWATDCVTPSVKVQKCDRYATCKHQITHVVEAAKNPNGHAYKTVTVAPTCDEVGYSYQECTAEFTNLKGDKVVCGHKTAPTNYVDATGHNYGPVVLKEGAKCDDANGYVQYCQNKELNEKGELVPCDVEPKPAAKPANAAHTYGDWQIEAGTCVTASKQYKVCSTCNDKVYNDKYEGKIDAANHVYVFEKWLNNEPTCTTGATAVMVCKSCTAGASTTKTVEVPANSKLDGVLDWTHQYTAKYAEKVNGTLYTYGTHEGATAAAYPATCQKNGYQMDGEYCVKCGAVKKAATVITKESVFNTIANHTDKTPTKTNSTKATCEAAATETWLTTCCGLITITIGKPVDHNYVDVDFKAPTCTDAGTHAHKACEWCGLHEANTTVITGCTLNCANHNAIEQDLSDYYVIAALGHTMKTQDAKAETCDAEGTAAYEYCAVCDIRVFDGKNYDLTKADQKKAFETAIAIAPHFNTYKFTIEKDQAATCTATGLTAGPYCKVCDAAKAEGELNKWETKKADHNNKEFKINDPAKAGYDCTKMTAVVTTCMNCGNHEATYANAKNSAHRLETWKVNDQTTTWAPAALKPGTNHCTAPTYTYQNCLDCNVGDVNDVVVEAAVGHYDAYGKISVKCNEIAAYIGRTCSDCLKPIVDTMAEHDMSTKTQAATCTTDGYEIKYCRGCNAASLTVTKVLPKLSTNGKHTQGVILETVPATATTAGYVKYVCATEGCGVTATDVIPATATLVVSGMASAQKVTAGTDVNYTVVYSGVAQTFKTVKVEVKYDATKFDFVEATSGLTENVFASADNGVVGITLVSKTDMTTAADGTALVDLKFTAKKYAMGDANFEINNAATKVTVVGLGNATGTGYITAEDALAILDTEEFNAELDINGDGMVDLIDVALVGTFAASAQTAKDYLVMLGTYDEIQATIDELYENGKLADCNKDGIVTINDYYALIAEVEVEINKLDSYTKISFESVEEFVMEVMNGMIKTVYA
ncbi:MAG: hypothetical protein IKB28_11110 [Clostridia bacterium]|nr:hypothetical protein [Clostridia bacterium]